MKVYNWDEKGPIKRPTSFRRDDIEAYISNARFDNVNF